MAIESSIPLYSSPIKKPVPLPENDMKEFEQDGSTAQNMQAQKTHAVFSRNVLDGPHKDLEKDSPFIPIDL